MTLYFPRVETPVNTGPTLAPLFQPTGRRARGLWRPGSPLDSITDAVKGIWLLPLGPNGGPCYRAVSARRTRATCPDRSDQWDRKHGLKRLTQQVM